MNREKIITLLLIGFGVLGLLYYLGKNKKVAAPGAGGPSVNAGGAAITRAIRSDTSGVAGSIPNIIASAAALTGQTYGSVGLSAAKQSGAAPAVISTSSSKLSDTLTAPSSFSAFQLTSPVDIEGNPISLSPTPSLTELYDIEGNPTGFQGSQLVASESPHTPAFPDLGDFTPDTASLVSSLDVGGTDYGSLYES
jgi:hypothetical protein